MALAVAQRRRNRLWAMFAMPGVGWLIAFFVVSGYAVAAGAFGSIAVGQTTTTFTVPICGDAAAEPNETFTITLSSSALRTTSLSL